MTKKGGEKLGPSETHCSGSYTGSAVPTQGSGVHENLAGTQSSGSPCRTCLPYRR